MPVALDVTPHPTPGTPQGMGYRLFSRFRIGTRLAAMMVLAATVSALLAAMGIRGLAAANDSLRSVYEERMTPVRSLAQIAHLMLSNQLQLQVALAASNPHGAPARTALQPEEARRAAQALEHNMLTIDQLWEPYAAAPKEPPEATLAVADKLMPGFGEQMRAISLNFVPTAILSRQVAVIRGSALIINLPGQPKSIAETLQGLPSASPPVHGIFAAVPYCIDLIGGPYLETDPAVCAAFRPKSAQRPTKA